ncbi:uncharacterized protein LOC108925819 [Scleropages formosus]|uniref:uncharacterized protein LOC108925819 n=1 Tax=Scleropages formosus TaxID=113540 RepID=UPI000877FE9F|nr:uncharacterized protein LOC108925819 [Scleropages formosus]
MGVNSQGWTSSGFIASRQDVGDSRKAVVRRDFLYRFFDVPLTSFWGPTRCPNRWKRGRVRVRSCAGLRRPQTERDPGRSAAQRRSPEAQNRAVIDGQTLFPTPESPRKASGKRLLTDTTRKTPLCTRAAEAAAGAAAAGGLQPRTGTGPSGLPQAKERLQRDICGHDITHIWGFPAPVNRASTQANPLNVNEILFFSFCLTQRADKACAIINKRKTLPAVCSDCKAQTLLLEPLNKTDKTEVQRAPPPAPSTTAVVQLEQLEHMFHVCHASRFTTPGLPSADTAIICRAPHH